MKPEIRFYHLTSTPVEKALPKLLEKIIAKNQRVLILTDSEEQSESLAVQLWTYHPNAFLPHGTHKDGFPAEHPIFLTSKEENPNAAEILIILNGALPKFLNTFQQVLDLFEGLDEDTQKKIETRWDAYKNKDYALTYWRQKTDGSWEKTRENPVS